MNRRQLLVGSASLMILTRPLRADTEDKLFDSWLSTQYANQPRSHEGVTVTLPALAENGNSVALTVEVQSPMQPDDYIQTIDVFAPLNPVPHLGRFYLNPATGIAKVSTRIRLGGDQTVHAVAATFDGRLLLGGADIVVTEAACLDFLI